jgi:hypothetical protein
MIAFRHVRFAAFNDKEATFAIGLPSRDSLMAVMETVESAANLAFGYALVHPRDSLDKKLGRKIAEASLTFRAVKLCHVEVQENKFVYHFEYVFPEIKYDRYKAIIALSVCAGSKNVYVEHVRTSRIY